jgi:hypothetical protein
MMEPSYVERDVFHVVSDVTLGCHGRRIQLRTYRLKDNPDTSSGNDISHTVCAVWGEHGYPSDAVFHLGSFYRVTVL